MRSRHTEVINMKILIKLEEVGLVCLAFYLFLALDYAWWWFPLLFFLPDMSLIGFLINKKAGATTYNFIHHKALSVALYLLGNFTQTPVLQVAGLVMLGHSSFDRALGFELQQIGTSTK
jgi:Domain of unknown function (DUF4260)